MNGDTVQTWVQGWFLSFSTYLVSNKLQLTWASVSPFVEQG